MINEKKYGCFYCLDKDNCDKKSCRYAKDLKGIKSFEKYADSFISPSELLKGDALQLEEVKKRYGNR